tara:strand:- start:399 stop:1100 length:702 start_codon:yes stop_codon:yes gene_type:complete
LKEIPDKFLMGLMVVALVVTVGSIGTVLFKLGGAGGITGFATTNTSMGSVNVTVIPQTAVSLVVGSIDFGSGTLTSGSSTLTAINTTATPGGSDFSSSGDFHLRNDGNVYVNVTINASTVEEYFSVTSGPTENMNYSYAVRNSSLSGTDMFNSSCTDFLAGSGDDDDGYALIGNNGPFGISLSTTPQTVCPNMSYVDNNDEINVSIFLLINSSVGEGSFNDTVEFLIYSHGHA